MVVLLILGRLGYELILILEACHSEDSLTMVHYYMVTHLEVLGQVGTLDAHAALVSHELLLAVEQVLLAGRDLDRLFIFLELTNFDLWSMEVYVDSALASGHFCRLPDHLNQNVVLSVFDLGRIYPTDIHPILQHFEDGLEVVCVLTQRANNLGFSLGNMLVGIALNITLIVVLLLRIIDKLIDIGLG